MGQGVDLVWIVDDEEVVSRVRVVEGSMLRDEVDDASGDGDNVSACSRTGWRHN